MKAFDGINLTSGYHSLTPERERKKMGAEKMIEMNETPFGDTLTRNSVKADHGQEDDPLEPKVKSGISPFLEYLHAKYLRMLVYNFLERPRTAPSIAYHSFVFFLIVTSLLLSILSTVEEFEKDPNVDRTSYILEYVLLAVFSCEYILRLWSCSSHGTYTGIWGRVKFIRKPYMVIDIIVIVATSIVIRFQGKSDYINISMFRFLRFVQVLRILRLDRQRGAFKMVSQVVYEHRQELLTCWYMSFIILVTCSFLVYLAERNAVASSGKMENLADGVYWGIISLLTIGYGDIAPQSWVAKLITCIFSLVGTAFFALPAGILGSGFALQVAQHQRQKHFNRRRVPAARVIQACWRRFAADHPERFPATFHPAMIYQALRRQTYSRETSKATAPSSPFFPNKKVAALLRKKGQSTSSTVSVDGGVDITDGEVPAAAVPLAVYLRERCHSEGNLVIGDSQVDSNQDTVISLPGKAFFGGYRRRSGPGSNTLSELTFNEKNAMKFLRLLSFVISLRKFREARRPYDVKDVLEQYSTGQIEMFGFMKKLQFRFESAIGFRDKNEKDFAKATVFGRLNELESKMETLDAKLDLVVRLLREGRSFKGPTPRSPLASMDQQGSLPPFDRKTMEKAQSLNEVEHRRNRLSAEYVNESSTSMGENVHRGYTPGLSRFKVTVIDQGSSGFQPVDL